MSTSARSVGFIGLGQMGFGMAGNLLKAGHDVLAYDVAADPLARFVALGGRAARHPAQIGAECQSVMVMVEDLTAAVESGRGVHQAMPVTSLARELYQLIDAKLGGLHGSNEVLRYYLEP